MYDYLFAFISRTSLKMSSRSYFSGAFGAAGFACTVCAAGFGDLPGAAARASAQVRRALRVFGAALCRGARFTEVCTAARRTFCGCMETGVSGMMGRSAVYSAATGIAGSSPVSYPVSGRARGTLSHGAPASARGACALPRVFCGCVVPPAQSHPAPRRGALRRCRGYGLHAATK